MSQPQVDDKILTLLSDQAPRQFYQIITHLDISPLLITQSLRYLVNQGQVIEERPGNVWQYRVEDTGQE